MKSLFAKVLIIPTSLLENSKTAFYVEDKGWVNSLSIERISSIDEFVKIDEDDNGIAICNTNDYFSYSHIKWPTKSSLLPVMIYKRDFSKYEEDPWL